LLKVPSRTLDIVRTLYQVRKFDIVVVPGTGILDDFGEPWYAMPYDLFKWSLAAMLGGRPFTFVSVGAGPIQHPLSSWWRLLEWRNIVRSVTTSLGPT
jgi:polysaccharide pyruvyl transferase WcaK-like protein